MKTPVSIASLPGEAITTVTDYVGGSAPIYISSAKATQPEFTFTGATVSKAAAASVGYVAHGLQSDNLAVFAGGTGDWAALNGTRVVTRTGADTFTVAVNTSAFAGSWDGTISTFAPRTSAPCWSIVKNYYDGSNPIGTRYVEGSPSDKYVHDSRASYGYQ